MLPLDMVGYPEYLSSMSTEAQRIKDATLKRLGVDAGILTAAKSSANIDARRRVVASMRACRTRTTKQLTLAEVAAATGLHWSTVRNYAAQASCKPWRL